MTQLTPITLEDGTTIYIEAKENIEIAAPETTPTDEETELTREELGKQDKGLRDVLKRSKEALPQEQIAQSFQAIEGTIKAYTNYTLKAFQDIANANIDKVTLEFGIKVGGKVGVPYVTEGSADSHMKITVECSFPKE